jgi:hypothetical protein
MADMRAARKAYYGKKMVTRARLVPHIEVRDSGDGKLAFTGYASTTDDSYTVMDWLGEYDETIARGAFGKALREQDDVRLLVNHEGVPIARTKSGTLNLSEILDPLQDPQGRGQTGLWCDAPDLDGSNPTVQEIASALGREDLSEMSMAFIATRQEWNEDYTQRTVLELRLLDVSIVTYPANPATSATIGDDRSADVDTARRERILTLIDSGRPIDEDLRGEVRAAFEERDALIAAGVEPEHAPDESEVRAAAFAAARLASARTDAGLPVPAP